MSTNNGTGVTNTLRMHLVMFTVNDEHLDVAACINNLEIDNRNESTPLALPYVEVLHNESKSGAKSRLLKGFIGTQNPKQFNIKEVGFHFWGSASGIRDVAFFINVLIPIGTDLKGDLWEELDCRWSPLVSAAHPGQLITLQEFPLSQQSVISNSSRSLKDELLFSKKKQLDTNTGYASLLRFLPKTFDAKELLGVYEAITGETKKSYIILVRALEMRKLVERVESKSTDEHKTKGRPPIVMRKLV